MTPSYKNSPIFPFDLNINEDQTYFLASPNYQSSSDQSSCHIFFSSATQYQTGHHRTKFYPPQYQPEVDNDASRGGSHDVEKINKAESGMKLLIGDENKKIKLKQKEESASPDCSSNSSSNNFPIRVCTDCNTTKTPLWRGGPKGPKSLCNACGIRQRKARKAMEAAAANGTTLTTAKSSSTIMKIKLKQKEKIPNHVIPYKKRWKVVESSSSSGSQNEKLEYDDFLVNLSKKVGANRIFPQDEKEAAILLMALSSDLLHS